MALSSVDFPAPFVPSRATTSPRPTCSDASKRTCTGP